MAFQSFYIDIERLVCVMYILCNTFTKRTYICIFWHAPDILFYLFHAEFAVSHGAVHPFGCFACTSVYDCGKVVVNDYSVFAFCLVPFAGY